MPRKGENIRKRKDGRWEARYEKSRDQNGRIQYGYVYAHTYDSVKKKKLAILCKNRPQTNIGRKIFFRNLNQEWLASVRYTVKISTYTCYETLISIHIIPEYGDIPVKYISSDSIYRFSEKLKKEGLSSRTIKNILILFHSILQYGEKQGYINHLSQLEFRYPKIIEHSFNIISQENLTKLISVLCTDTSRFCLYLKEFITVNVETEWIVM